MTSIITEEDALKILKDPDSKITIDEAQQIVSALQKSVIDRDEALEHKTLGAHSFYEGEYNILCVAERMLQKLTLDKQED